MIFFLKFRNYRNSWVFFSVSLDSTFLTFLAMGRISRGSQGADASCWCYLVSALPSVWGRGSSQFGQTVSGARWRALGSQAPLPSGGATLAMDSEAGGEGLGFGNGAGSRCWGLIAEHVVITEMTKIDF